MQFYSVEQYRETDKTASEICKELEVAYLLEGSFQKYGDQARLIVQLIIPGMEGHIWANEYNRNWKDIFSVQSEVAQTIAQELQAVITPDEKQLIDQIPTTNLTAYDFYQRGKNEHLRYQFDNDNKEALERAEDLYYKALEYDSTFAQAYTGLAWVYMDKHYWETFLTENFLDSMLILANIALSYDDKLSDAYIVKGRYNSESGLREQAITAYDKALKFNPNSWMAYSFKGWLYREIDLVKAIDNLQKAISLNHGLELPDLFRMISVVYHFAGFLEKAKYYTQEALLLDGDSVAYFTVLANIEFDFGNLEKAREFIEKAYVIDSSNILMLSNLGLIYMHSGDFKESLNYFEEYVKKLKSVGNIDINDMAKIGYVYWQQGYKEEAEYYFNEQINYCNRMIELGRNYTESLITYYDLATVYAFRGEKDKAYENLKIFNQRQIMAIWADHTIKNDPLFDNIRDEPEFQQIVRDVEAKYQAEHERVRQWLEENGML
jgi:tetratricopeptide (TPR) repeat protein